MRYSIFAILKITTCCAAVLAACRLIWSFEPRVFAALPLFLVVFAILGVFLLPFIFVPMAILFASQKGSQLDPQSVPVVIFFFDYDLRFGDHRFAGPGD